MMQKIDNQFNENVSTFNQDKGIVELFKRVQIVVCKHLESIIQEEDDEDRGYITAKDFMNDFATDEFLTKNIRVRPLSGVTRGDMEETKTNYEQNF